MKIIYFNEQLFYLLFKNSNNPKNLLSFSGCNLKCKYKMEMKTYLPDFVENAGGDGAI